MEKEKLITETMYCWARIAAEAIAGVKAEVFRLQKELARQKAEVAELLEKIAKWRSVNDPPEVGIRVFVADARGDEGLGIMWEDGSWTLYGVYGVYSEPEYWMPIPELPEVTDL
jgi:hypothetical protein